jgi:hypothetical protein
LDYRSVAHLNKSLHSIWLCEERVFFIIFIFYFY